jgi:cytochrome P450
MTEMGDEASASRQVSEKQRMSLEGDDAGILNSENPQATYVAMAAGCPVHRNADGTVTALRLADIASLNRNKDVLGIGGPGPSLGGTRRLIPLDLDGPEHTKYRRILDPLFAPKKIAPLAESVRALANELIDGFIDAGEVEIFDAFCEILPSTVFLRLIGLPQSDLPFFLGFKNAILKPDFTKPFDEILADVLAASESLYGYFDNVLDDREAKGEPGDDLIGWFMTVEVDGRRLSREEVLDILYLQMIAGLDTVAASLANLIAWLARHPDQRARLVADPSLWPAAVEELMRFTSPVTTGFRYPQVDIELGGETIAAGTQVIVSWAAANLDPEVFADPLTVDFGRHPNPHIAFASGSHRCLGSHLARLELRVALETLHTRIPDYRIIDGHEVEFTANPRTPVNGLPLVWNR